MAEDLCSKSEKWQLRERGERGRGGRLAFIEAQGTARRIQQRLGVRKPHVVAEARVYWGCGQKGEALGYLSSWAAN
jgi:hypothetical protein